MRYWPWSSSTKQTAFIGELEEILELVPNQVIFEGEDKNLAPDLFKTIGKCIASDHFQVAERALFLWNNEQLLTQGCLNRMKLNHVLPHIIAPLMTIMNSGHWNQTVESLAENVNRQCYEADQTTFEAVQAAEAKGKQDIDDTNTVRIEFYKKIG